MMRGGEKTKKSIKLRKLKKIYLKKPNREKKTIRILKKPNQTKTEKTEPNRQRPSQTGKTGPN